MTLRTFIPDGSGTPTDLGKSMDSPQLALINILRQAFKEQQRRNTPVVQCIYTKIMFSIKFGNGYFQS